MKDETARRFQEIAKKLLSDEGILPDEIPNIDVYMDQLTTFMDRRLREQTRRPKTDKVLTKTMINNYTKNDLLPPPVKKKYSREHLILLIYIFYYKSTLSMNDINTLLTPLKTLYEEKDPALPSLEDVYRASLRLAKEQSPNTMKDMERMFATADEAFLDVPENRREELQQFAFLSLMAYDVYVKLSTMERILDDIEARNESAKPKQKPKKKKGGEPEET